MLPSNHLLNCSTSEEENNSESKEELEFTNTITTLLEPHSSENQLPSQTEHQTILETPNLAISLAMDFDFSSTQDVTAFYS